mmetsp:Transcript_12711/g.22871  ORF Transcript_12711/g.22871 Transcript_12711/m.22871 type:complete len:294 (+) Transcript_12711:147-1028(+)
MKLSVESVKDYVKANPNVAVGIVITAVLIVMTPVVLQFLLGGKSDSSKPIALDAMTYRRFKLSDKANISKNTRIFRFALNTPEQRLGLPIGRHISLKANIDGKDVRRPYTPISGDDDLGYFDLLIKVYPEPHGTMSRHLDSLKIGDSIDVRGPSGSFDYKPNMKKTLAMICGGTGLTPMWQVFTAILKNPDDVTEIRLIFANVTVDDILLQERLDQLQSENPDRFKLYYVLNDPPPGWSGGVGFVSEDMIREHVGTPSASDKMVLLCGPPPMTAAMRKHLNKLGYSDSEIFKF